METKEIYEWAVKGIRAEVDKLGNDIITGKRLISEYEKGGKPKTPKTKEEIREIINRKEVEIDELNRKRIALQFDIEDM